MKRRIAFQKLIDGRYPLNIQLEVFNWMLKTGQRFETYKEGLDNVMYGYSAYNHRSYTDFGRDIDDRTLLVGFVNAVVKTPSDVVQKWRETERVVLGKYRMLEFKEEFPLRDPYSNSWNLYVAIRELYGFESKKLKKAEFHSNYPDRTEPHIKNIEFSTTGNGYRIKLGFTFKECPDCCWDRMFYQFVNNQSIDMFIYNTRKEIRERFLLNSMEDKQGEK